MVISDLLQPTTPKALPFARTSRGKISAGYSHGTVSLRMELVMSQHIDWNICVFKTYQVAPKTNVNMYTKLAAAAPYEFAAAMSPASRAFRPRRDMPPARNMAIPWPTEPQYLQSSVDILSSDSCLDRSLQRVSSSDAV